MYIYGIKKQCNETQYLIDLLKTCDDIIAGKKSEPLPEAKYLKLWKEFNDLNNLIFDSKDGILFDLNKQKLLDSIEHNIVVVGTQKVFNGDKNVDTQIWEVFYDTKSANLFTYALEKDHPIYFFDLNDNIFEETKQAYIMKQRQKEELRLGPKSFKGDIIITDPCYVVKNRDTSKQPQWDDYFDYKSMSEYPDYDGSTSDLFLSHCKLYDEAYDKWDEMFPDDQDICNDYIDMDKLGFTTYLTYRTLCGDWDCSVRDGNNHLLGNFGADSGMVGVFLLDEVLKYNPDFNEYLNKNDLVTVIKNFEGTVSFDIVDNNTLVVVGNGNINFKSSLN